MNTLWLVALGGASGSVLRYMAGKLLGSYAPGSFPWATLSVNLLGCLFIGVAYAWMNRQGQNTWAPLLITGFLGGFTTFSAFGWECMQMIRDHDYLFAACYSGSSMILGILLVFLGHHIAS